MNKKEEKVIRLYQSGHDVKVIARKLGYEGSSLTKGIKAVRKILINNGIQV